MKNKIEAMFAESNDVKHSHAISLDRSKLCNYMQELVNFTKYLRTWVDLSVQQEKKKNKCDSGFGAYFSFFKNYN